VQDAIRLTPHLTLSLGLRAESSSGWNEAHGRAATYTYPGGVISNQPTIGDSAFTENKSVFLPQPRRSCVEPFCLLPHGDSERVRNV
jgi:hypothetical protein